VMSSYVYSGRSLLQSVWQLSGWRNISQEVEDGTHFEPTIVCLDDGGGFERDGVATLGN
jgi:hypothetical protein